MTRLIIIRHGETEWNAGEVFRGRADIDLNEQGILQAKLLTAYLADIHPEAVYSSPLIRAIRTARGIATANSLDIIVDPDLIDLDYGEWQGMPAKDVQAIYRDMYATWKKAPETVTFPRGESLASVRQRSDRVISRIMKAHHGTVVIVSHRVVNKVLICGLLGLDLSHFWNIRQDNCGITSFTGEKGSFVLECHNDISFLKDVPGVKLGDF